MMMYALSDFESGLCPPNHSTIGPSVSWTGPCLTGRRTSEKLMFSAFGAPTPHRTTPS